MKVPENTQESTTTTGTGNITVSGATAGKRALSATLSAGDTFGYRIDDGGTNVEVGVGTLLTSTTFSRAVITSTNSDALVSFAAGTKTVTVVALGQNLVNPTNKAFGSVSGSQTLDYSASTVFSMTLTGDVTQVVSNPAPSGSITAITGLVTGDGTHVWTPPASGDWGPAGPPPLIASGQTLMITMYSVVGMSSYIGSWGGGVPIAVSIVIDLPGTVVTTGSPRVAFRVPSTLNGKKMVACAAHVTTASSSGLPTVMIHSVTNAVDMLTTALTIDATEKDSITAATAAVIDGSHNTVATGDEIAINVTTAGTGAKGLIVEMQFA